MKVDRHELEDILVQKFEEIKSNPRFVEDLKKVLAKNKILPGDIQRIINKDIPISEVEDAKLFLITNAIFSLTEQELFNPEKYFTEKEIKIAQRYEEQQEERITLPITINNVIALNSQEFITALPIKTLVDWYNSDLIEYNSETQRNPRERRRASGEIVTMAYINPQSVRDITLQIMNGTFKADTIILNILSDGREKFEFDEQKGQLTIYEGEIDILDGFHRLNAFAQVINELNPDSDFITAVAIKNFTIKEAQSYVAQINTVNKMPTTYIQKLKGDRYSDIVAKKLQEESELKGRISPTHTVNNSVGHIVSYKTLTDEIEENFKIQSKVEALKLSEYLVQFFDYLLGGNYIEEFRREVSGKTFMSKHHMFIGYLALAGEMHKNEIAASKVNDILSEIDLSENNQELADIIKDKKSLADKRFKVKMREFFKDIVKGGTVNAK
jgi:hypothetical protein